MGYKAASWYPSSQLTMASLRKIDADSHRSERGVTVDLGAQGAGKSWGEMILPIETEAQIIADSAQIHVVSQPRGLMASD